MKPLHYFAIVLLLTSSVSYASCNNYGAAGVHCSGQDGSTTSYHNYSGGASTVNDNRGNTASINRYEGGYIGVVPQTSVTGVNRPSSRLNPGSRMVPVIDPFNR